MRNFLKLLVLFALLGASACSRTTDISQLTQPATRRGPRGPLSADEHDRAADYHTEEAKKARAASEKAKSDEEAMGPVQCFDKPVDEQGASGGEGYRQPRKCWAPYDRPSAKLAREAEWHEKESAAHRRQAQLLRDDERAACTTLSGGDPNPFLHPENIDEIKPHTEGGELRGARVVFRAGGGRTARLIESSLDCHLARLAVAGYPDDGRDPVAVPDVEVLVSGDEREIAVVVRVDAERAEQVFERAKKLER